MNATTKANTQAPKSAKQAASVQSEAIIPAMDASPAQAASLPFPSILYPRTDSKGEARKQRPYIHTEGRTIHARIGGVSLSMVMPDTDTISIHDMVQCAGTKIFKDHAVDGHQFHVPAVIFFANALAGMAERINTNAEKQETMHEMIAAWQGCYPMPSDERALNARPAFTWGSFLATYQPTPDQEPVWTALRGKTTTELAKLTRGLREKCEWLRVAMDVAGYVEPVSVAIPDDLAALLG